MYKRGWGWGTEFTFLEKIKQKSDEIMKPRSFLLVAEDEVINNPGFPGPCNQKLHLPDSVLFARGGFKTAGSQILHTRPRLPVIQIDRFKVWHYHTFPAILNTKQDSTL